MLVALGAAWDVTRDRWRRGPLRPTWSWAFEVVARTLKAYAARIARLSWTEQRGAWARIASPLAGASWGLRRQRATVGGVPAVWFFPRKTDAVAPVILYFHGGSFIYGSTRTHGGLIAGIARAAHCHTLAPEYRLAPEHPFPAAIEDGLACYRALLDAGIAAARIVFAGDSAGGNLALLVMRRAREVGLPLPGGAALLCPWSDLAARGGSLVDHARFDWAEPEDFARWQEAYLAGADPAAASPNQLDLAGFPPLLIQCGTAEMLSTQITELAARAQAAGVRTQFHAYPDMIHDWQMLAPTFALSREALAEIGAFVRKLAGPAARMG